MPLCFWSGIGSQPWAAAWPFIVLWFAFKLAIWALVITALVYGIRRLRRQCGTGSLQTPLEVHAPRPGRLTTREAVVDDAPRVRLELATCHRHLRL